MFAPVAQFDYCYPPNYRHSTNHCQSCTLPAKPLRSASTVLHWVFDSRCYLLYTPPFPLHPALRLLQTHGSLSATRSLALGSSANSTSHHADYLYHYSVPKTRSPSSPCHSNPLFYQTSLD